MAPLAWAGIAAAGAAAAWWRWNTIKVGDLVSAKVVLAGVQGPPQTVKVTSIQDSHITGNVVAVINGVSQDTGVSVTLQKQDIIANLSKRFW